MAKEKKPGSQNEAPKGVGEGAQARVPPPDNPSCATSSSMPTAISKRRDGAENALKLRADCKMKTSYEADGNEPPADDDG